MIKHQNPWTSISHEDYDKHMNLPTVNQQKFLSDCFHLSLVKNAPPEILVIGCGTGNGLEHIDPDITNRTTVIDINIEFLNSLKQRFQNVILGLEVIHDDLHHFEFQHKSYSLVYAGLVFEFIEPKQILKKVYQALRQDGKFEVVLQIPSDSLPTVSSTNIESIKNLNSIVKLVDHQEFCEMCKDMGMNLVSSNFETLDSGKSFFLGSYQ